MSASVWGKGIVCMGEIETMRLWYSIADVASEKARIEAEASEKVQIDADDAAEIACIDADVVSEKARVEAEKKSWLGLRQMQRRMLMLKQRRLVLKSRQQRGSC